MWLLPVYNIDKTGLHEMSTFKQPLKTSKAAARSSPNAPWWSTAATKQATWRMAFRNQCPEGDLSHFNYTSIPSITQFLLQNGPLCFECTPPKAACEEMPLDVVSHNHGVMGRESHDTPIVGQTAHESWCIHVPRAATQFFDTSCTHSQITKRSCLQCYATQVLGTSCTHAHHGSIAMPQGQAHVSPKYVFNKPLIRLQRGNKAESAPSCSEFIANSSPKAVSTGVAGDFKTFSDPNGLSDYILTCSFMMVWGYAWVACTLYMIDK